MTTMQRVGRLAGSGLLAVALLGGCDGADREGDEVSSPASNSHFAIGPVDPALPISFMDERLTKDPGSDALLTKMLTGVQVRSLRAARLSDRTPRSPETVFAVTERGMYEADIAIPPTLAGAQETPPESIEPRGWSAAVDSRANVIPPTKLGLVSSPVGQCSGALIGLRIVRTAAHCVVVHTTGGGTVPANTSLTFFYRRNGAATSAIATSQILWFGGNYIAQGCGRSKDLNGDGDTDFSDPGEYDWGYFQNPAACSNEDWALAQLPDLWWGAGGANSFGYRMPQSSDVGLAMASGGYPGCGASPAGRPANCVNQGYYQDNSAGCTLGAYTSTSPDLRLFKSGCDTSAGNSGGPIWDRNALWYLGTYQWEECSGANCLASNTAPNHYLGHNQWLFDFQNTVRANSGRP